MSRVSQHSRLFRLGLIIAGITVVVFLFALVFKAPEVLACNSSQVDVQSIEIASTISNYPNCSIDDRYNHDQFQPHYKWYKGQDIFQVVKTWPGLSTTLSQYERFSIFPDLPTGLSLHSRSGIISGVASQLTEPKQYTVMLQGVERSMEWGSGIDIWTFSAEVVDNSDPLAFVSTMHSSQDWRLSQDVRLELPLATGGTGNIKYSISHGLPNGFNLKGNVITGRANDSFSVNKYTEHISVQTNCIQLGISCSNRFEDSDPIGTSTLEIGTVEKRYKYFPFQGIKFHTNNNHQIGSALLPKTVPDTETFNRNYEQFHSIVEKEFFWKFDLFNKRYTLLRSYSEAMDQLFDRECPIRDFEALTSHNHGELYVNYCLSKIRTNSSQTLLLSKTDRDIGRFVSSFRNEAQIEGYSYKLFEINKNYDYYWIATDEMGRTAVTKFMVTLLPDFSDQPNNPFEFTVDWQYWTEGTEVSLDLPELANPTGVTAYTIDPKLPPGLSLDQNRIVGAVKQYSRSNGIGNNNFYPWKYTWTATDETGISRSTSFRVDVNSRPPLLFDTDQQLWNLSEQFNVPIFRRKQIGEFIWQVDQPVFQELPLAWNAGHRLHYMLNGSLPDGLVFDRNNAIIFGTPVQTTERKEFQIIAENCTNPNPVTGLEDWPGRQGNDPVLIYQVHVLTHCSDINRVRNGFGRILYESSDVAEFSIEILPATNGNVGPVFNDTNISDQEWTLGNDITLDLPEAVGGAGSLRYFLSHSLPAGLESNHNQISGNLDKTTDNRIFTVPLDNIAGIPTNLELRILKKYIYTPWQWHQENTKASFNTDASSIAELATATLGMNTVVGLEVFLLDKNEGRVLFHNIDPEFDYRTVFDLVDINYDTYLLPGEQLEYVNLNEPIMWWESSFRPNHRNQINIQNHDYWLGQEYTYIWTVVDENNNTDQIAFNVNINPGNIPTFADSPILNFSNNSEQKITRGIDSYIYPRRLGFFASFDLPQAAGGEGEISYRIEPDLFGGMSFDGQHTISGTFTGEKTPIRLIPSGDFVTSKEVRNILTPRAGLAILDKIDKQDPNYDRAVAYRTEQIRRIEAENSKRVLSPPPIRAAYNLDRNDKFYLIAEDEQGNQNSIPFYLTVLNPLSTQDGNLPPIDKIDLITGAEVEITLPSVEWIAESFCYKITPELPEGLEITDRTISGTPQNITPGTTYTYSAYKMMNLSTPTYQWCLENEPYVFQQHNGLPRKPNFTQEFELAIIPDPRIPTFIDVMVENQSWKVGSPHSLTLPTATGGDDPIIYSLSPVLPDGMGIQGNTISGIPTTEAPRTDYTWTVTDADGDTSTITFNITVVADLKPSFDNNQINDQVWVPGRRVKQCLPTAIGGDQPITYELNPALPTSNPALPSDPYLYFRGTGCTGHIIYGTPSEVRAETEYTWTATDTDGDSTSLSFNITIATDQTPTLDQTPTFSTNAIADQTWLKDQPTTLTLPIASGGDGSLFFMLAPMLPAGLALTNQTISGTPTQTEPGTTYTWTVYDANGSMATLTFSIEIVEDLEPSFGTDTVTGQTWRQGRQVTVALPSASGGDHPLTYELSPTLPTGLNLVGHSISGVPTDTMPTTAYTWTVTDADGDTATLSFTITITADLEPTFGTTVISNQEWTENQPVSMLLPEASGGNGTLAYTLSPALPAGLSVTGNTVSGTPTDTIPTTAYTWTATDTDGDTVSLMFNITIATDLEPTFGTTVISNQEWTENQPASLILPEASGDDGTLTYELSPVLPSGLSLTDKTIGGSPSQPMAATGYVWTVTDEDGDQDELPFTITVTEDRQPSFGTQRIPDLLWEHRQAVTYNLPQASGGDTPLTYTLTPELPQGLTLTGHTISGTTANTPSSSRYRWSVTDTDRDTTHLEFTIRVGPEAPSEDFTRRWRVGDAIWIIFGGYEDNQPGWTYRIQPLDLNGNPAPNQNLPTFLTKEINRILYGTPTTTDLPPNTVRAGKIRWTAADPQGILQATQTLTWTLHPDLKPTFPNTPTPTYTWIHGEPLTNTWLPQATGGDQPLTYTLTPPPPPGTQIIHNPHNNTNQITGTPTQHILTPQTYTWTATDNDQHQNRDTTQTQIRIQIIPDLTPRFTTNNTHNHLTIGHTYTNHTIQPQATGGNTQQNTQTYQISPPLPPNLTLNPTNGTITGTPTGPPQTTTHTWTYTDTDNTQPETIQTTITIETQHPPNINPQQIATTQRSTQTPITTQPTVQTSTHTEISSPTSFQTATQEPTLPTNTSTTNTITIQHPSPQAAQLSTIAPNTHSTQPNTEGPTLRFTSKPASITPLANPIPPATENSTPAPSMPQFTDIGNSTHQQNIQKLAQQGITQGCKPNQYCPNRPITRAEIATLLTRTLNLTPTHNNYFTDITDNTHQTNINTLAHHQITQSCNPPHNTRYCPDRTVTRAEIATLLTRAFNLTPTKINYFADIAGNTHQQNINTLTHHQITQGCHYQEKIHNSRYCPNRPITRAELATLLIKTQQHQQTGSP